MPNSKVHKRAGLLAGTVISASMNIVLQQKERIDNPYHKFSFLELMVSTFLGALLGFFAGIAPDILEPATNPHHREFFHSFLFLVSLLVSGYFIIRRSSRNRVVQSALAGSLGSYFSHIVLDATTPTGIKFW